jgi:hypothetical protein
MLCGEEISPYLCRLRGDALLKADSVLFQSHLVSSFACIREFEKTENCGNGKMVGRAAGNLE